MLSDPDPPSATPLRADHPVSAGRGPRRGRGAAALAGRGLVLASLLALTAWNMTRSDTLGQAEAAYRRGDFVTGVRLAGDHLDRRPWSRQAARAEALCLSRLDFAETAEASYRRAGPLGLDDLHVRAYGLIRGNRRLEAEAAYRRILERWPDDPLALRRLGAELMTMMRWDAALEMAERLARIPGSEVDGLAMVGAIQYHENKETSAVAYRRVLEIDPELRRLPSDRGFRQVFWTQVTEDLLAIARPDEARRLLEGAPAADRSPILTWLLGRAHYWEGAFDAADRCWREAVQGDPGLTDGWIDLGRLALARNRPAEAIVPLERASSLDPRAYTPAYHLALAYHRLGQVDRADRYLEKAERHRRESHPTAEAGSGSGSPPLPARPGTSRGHRPVPSSE